MTNKNISIKSFDVDLVYLWVNGNDPVWREKRNATIGMTHEDSSVNCEGRYADNDELKYNLRAADMYAPWIRRIFIVTDNQAPQWLDSSNPKIRIVDHTEIMPPEALPTFNSSVIEHFIHLIPDLSEHFLYANDDMFINRPVDKSDFFGDDGKPIIRVIRRPFRKFWFEFSAKVLNKPHSYYNRTLHRAALLIRRQYGKYYNSKPHHNIDAYCKSDYRL